MKLTYVLLSSALFAATLSSCGTSRKVALEKDGIVKTETAVETENAIQEVMYGSWSVTTVNGRTVNGIDRPYVEFGKDTTNPFIIKVYAYNGCNYLNGEFAAGQGGSLHPTREFAATMRMCEGADYEMGVTLALNTVASYSIQKVDNDFTMNLINAQGKTMMTLRKVETEFVNGAWDVTSINGASVSEDLGIQLVLDIEQQSIHGNAGCNTLNGKIVTNPDVANSISFTQLITTRMTCPNIATEQALIAALSSVTTVVPGETEGTAILRNAEDNAVVTLTRANL